MCKNCFNGCGTPTSDKCIKYTGPDIPALEIENGDNLLHVETQIFTFIQSIISGQGIIPTISEDDICTIIENNLPECGACTEISLNALLEAIIKSICQINDRLILVEAIIENLEDNYTIDCLDGVSSSSGTHNILQAAITKICAVDGALDAFITYVAATYVTISSINDYIDAYITSTTSAATIASRMVPYSAVPYFGTLANFDLSGAGIGDWNKIYLCNGQNGTPDLRGRTLVGSTAMGATPMSPVVDPGIGGNPNYILHAQAGANNITLSELQMPSHNHSVDVTIASTISPNPHNHGWTGNDGTGWPDGSGDSTGAGNPFSFVRHTKIENVNLAVTSTATVSENNSGGGQSHLNIQPSYASYYIIHIP